jgi:heat shock protein HtpX
MMWFKRISLFIITNILVMMMISIVFNLIIAFTGLNYLNNYYGFLIVFSVVWGMGGAFISLLLSKWMAKRAMGVIVLDPTTNDADSQWLVQTVHRLARSAGLQTMPEVGIYDSPELNAFATGPSKSNSLVAVSTGLLRTMNRDEAEGVLGHEMTHIANGDMVTMTLLQGIVNAFVLFFARIIADVIANQVEERNRQIVYFLSTMVLQLAFSILGSIVVSYFSRRREFRADYGGAVIAGRDKMLGGLRKLKSQFEQIEPDNRALATLKISNKPSGAMALFSTHPPLDERIDRLEHAILNR